MSSSDLIRFTVSPDFNKVYVDNPGEDKKWLNGAFELTIDPSYSWEEMAFSVLNMAIRLAAVKPHEWKDDIGPGRALKFENVHNRPLEIEEVRESWKLWQAEKQKV